MLQLFHKQALELLVIPQKLKNASAVKNQRDAW